MGNLMTSMFTGVSGLRVNQGALNTTAHNLANVDTKGYVRQQVLTKDYSYNTVGYAHASTMQIGLGTDMEAIRQVRDIFLDKSYRLEIGRQGFYEAQYEAVSEIESLFGELEGETFQDTMDEFWTSLQELTKEPDSIVKKSSFIETAISFIERAENISNQMKDYQINLNTEISKKVNRINQIGDQIRELNIKIRRYESGTEAANDFRDARNKLLDELGEIAKYTYSEDSVGIVSVNLEGMQFVTDDTVFHLTTKLVNGSSAMIKPVWKNTDVDLYVLDSAFSTNNNTDVGSLKGLLVARGDNVAKNTSIPKRADFANDSAYNQAVAYYNNNINPSVIMTAQAQFDQLIHGIVTTINDILVPNVSVNDFATNMDYTTAGYTINSITYDVSDGSGGTITMTVPASDYNTTLLWDEAKAPVGNDADKTKREALFNRKNEERYTKATMTLFDGTTTTTKEVYIYNEEYETDNYTLFTLGEIEVNEIIKNNYSVLPLIANDNSGYGGAYDITTCEKLTNAWNTVFATLDPNTLTDSNFNDYYKDFIGGIATRGEVYNTIATNQEHMVESIDNQRQQVAGVSSDEELTNLIKFQHGYNAAARYISVIDQMLEHIVTRL